MVLHTVIDAYDIFYGGEQPEKQATPPEYIDRQNGGYFWGCRLPEGFRIDRIISTNPVDYLAYQPGTVLPEAVSHG